MMRWSISIGSLPLITLALLAAIGLGPAITEARELRAVTVQWDAPDGGGEPEEYRVYVGARDRSYYYVEVLPADAREVTLTVPAWKRICFTVTAANVGGESPWGAEVCQEAMP